MPSCIFCIAFVTFMYVFYSCILIFSYMLDGGQQFMNHFCNDNAICDNRTLWAARLMFVHDWTSLILQDLLLHLITDKNWLSERQLLTILTPRSSSPISAIATDARQAELLSEGTLVADRDEVYPSSKISTSNPKVCPISGLEEVMKSYNSRVQKINQCLNTVKASWTAINSDGMCSLRAATLKNLLIFGWGWQCALYCPCRSYIMRVAAGVMTYMDTLAVYFRYVLAVFV